MGDFTIEKSIPIPTSGLPSSHKKYPWVEMQIGDSFFVPGLKKQSAISSTAIGWAKRNAPGRRFTTRLVDGGCRIWRVE